MRRVRQGAGRQKPEPDAGYSTSVLSRPSQHVTVIAVTGQDFRLWQGESPVSGRGSRPPLAGKVALTKHEAHHLWVEVVAMALTDEGPAAHDTTTRAAGLRRYRRLGFLTVLLALLGVVTVLMSGVYPIRLLRTDVHCGRTASGDVNGQLQCLVSEYTGQDPSVHNIELAVAKGDGSYSWAGSAGLAHQGGTPMAAETPIYLASVTKIYIATLIMLLSQDKLLSLDDPAARYLPASLINGIDIYGGHDYSRQVTVRQLMSMTSGIPDYYEEKGTDGKTGYDLFLADPARTWTAAEMINRARTDLTPRFAPGQGLYYSDTNYQVLGTIIENITRTSLAGALQNYLFRPLGLRHPG